MSLNSYLIYSNDQHWKLRLNILVAEDDKDIALSYKLALEQHNHVVIISYNGTVCITQYRKEYQSVKDKVVSGETKAQRI